jgi:hypothetical protein
MNFRFPLRGSGRVTPAASVTEVAPPAVLRPVTARPQALGRIVPFQPAGQMPPLFHLHIPRCAGTSVRRLLGRLYGEAGLLAGVQDIASEIVAGRRAPERADCLSGSLPLMRWELLRDNAAFARMTVLRDPWARLVSQINRLVVLGHSAGPDGSAAQALAMELMDADFTSRAGLERVRRRVPMGEGGLDNLQTRMLLTGTMSAMVKPLQARDVDRAAEALEGFAVIGFCEDMVATERAVLAHARSDLRPMPAFEGAGKGGLLSVRNDLAREVFQPWIAFDQDLYRRARALVAARQPV